MMLPGERIAAREILCPGELFFMKNRVAAHVPVTAAHGGARSRPKSPRGPQGRQTGAQRLTFRRPGAPFSVKNRESGPSREHLYLLCFHPFTRPGPIFFAPRTGVGSRLGPGLSFSLFLWPPVRKSAAEGGQRVPNVSPNALKSPPGDLQKSMKNRLCGLRGCPGSPGRSRGTPPARKVY